MRACPFCAEEIQDAAVVCKHCKRDIPSTTRASVAEGTTRPSSSGKVVETDSSPTRKRNFVAALLLALLVLVGVVVVSAGDADSNPGAQALIAAVSAPSVIELATNQELVIPAGSVQSFEWEPPQRQPNCRVSGHIEVTNGGSKDVVVLVMPKDDYQNYVNGHEAKVYFQTDKTSAVTLNVNTGQTAPLIVAISNGFSLLSDKTVRITDLRAVCS